MCGICGRINFEADKHVDSCLIASMVHAMEHRGPDDEGMYVSGPVGLGHKRLSIIDLNRGKQPICNEDGTIQVVYNGEIYNYRELTSLLQAKGHAFRTETDTEVIVHLYEEYGEESLSALRGMFAFAIWDNRKKLLFLARDRVGIKPLYYYAGPDFLVFGSEIKSLLADPSVKREMDMEGVNAFLTHYFAQGPHTLLKGVYKLTQAHCLTVQDGKISLKRYWDLTFPRTTKTDFRESVSHLDDLLRQTVRDHMISDVPVGFLLSGGVDSTGLLSYAVHETGKKISSFTVGFDNENFADERTYARLAAKKFGTDHYEMSLTAQEFVDFLPKYVWYMEEPVCEPPAIALYYVTRLARQHVKVLISGEGGDEAFAGYQTYRNLRWLEVAKRMLGPLRGALPPLVAGAGRAFGSFNNTGLMKKSRKYAPFMALPLERYYYSRASNPFRFLNAGRSDLFSAEFLHGMAQQQAQPFSYFSAVSNQHNLNKMLYVDTNTYLADDLLIKADKMTMANSVELRVPLLDHKVLEFAAALPAAYKLHGLTTKYILKKALEPMVPAAIVHRKKTGFPVPYDRWLRKDSLPFFRDLLLDGRTSQRGYLNRPAVESLFDANNGHADYSQEIFCLAVLELWRRIFLEGDRP